jgi:uncharacterized protein (TIGR02001 family)
MLAAAAQGRAAGNIGGSLALTSDYVFRGLSQTCGKPAAQADLHYRWSGPRTAESFLGVWGSTDLASQSCPTPGEINIYLGHSWLTGIADSSATLTYAHYAYPGSADGHYDYDELEGAWAFQDRLFLTLAWVPNALGYTHHGPERDRNALSFGAQLNEPIGTRFTASAGVGYDQIADITGAGFAFWNAGLAYGRGAAQIGVSYFGTADRARRLYGGQGGNRWAATVIWRF